MDLYTLYLLRHGQSEGNRRRIYQGQADFPLTPRGRRQAQALAARWQREALRLDAILSSPLSRARETAEIIAAALQAPLSLDDIWLERSNGSTTGRDLSRPENAPITPMTNPYQSAYEQAESDWQLFLRAGQALHTLLSRPPGAYLVVSHGGLLNQVVYAILGLTPQGPGGPRFRFANTGFATFSYAPAKHSWYVLGFNDTAHLMPLHEKGRDDD